MVGHESLTKFVTPNIERPIIAKIHRGLYFNPFNRQQELDGLAEGWKDTLTNMFRVYTPVMIGYAGGDQSLMKILQDKNTRLNGLFWCYWNKEEPSEEIQELVKSKNGCLIPIDGFDHMMFMLSRQLNFENPKEEVMKVAKERIERYDIQYEEFKNRIRQEAKKDNDENLEMKDTLQEINSHNEELLKKATLKVEKEQTAESYLERGSRFERLKMYSEAIKDYTQSIDLEPTNAVAYNGRGNAY